MTRIALVGLGNMGRNHFRILRNLDDVELVAVCDANPAAQNICKEAGIAYYADIDSMLIGEKLDAVDVCVPTFLHFELAMKALEKGLDVFVEKPVTTDVASAKALLAKSEERKKIVMVGHVERFNPVVNVLKSKLEGKRLRSLSFTRVGPQPPQIRDSGVILDIGIHDLDLAYYLTGMKPQTLFCIAPSASKYEDSAQLAIKLENGVSATIHVNWLTPYKVRRIEAITDECVYVADLLRTELMSHFDYTASPNPTYKTELIPVRYEEPLLAELKHFAECVKYRKTPRVGVSEAMISLLAVDAAIKSRTDNKSVSLIQ